MINAIDQYSIEGVETTLPFGKFVFEHEAFRSGNFDTHFVKSHFDPDALKKVKDKEAELAALLALKLFQEEQNILRAPH